MCKASATDRTIGRNTGTRHPACRTSFFSIHRLHGPPGRGESADTDAACSLNWAHAGPFLFPDFGLKHVSNSHPRLPVVDGHIVHSHGRVPMLLNGHERGAAHVELLTNISASNRGIEARRRVLELAKRDPSLLLEPLPARYPLPRQPEEDVRWHNSDTVWANHSKWYEHWLAIAFDPNSAMLDVVEVMLKAGIHPDDDAVWNSGRLLLKNGWATDPDRLSLALRHGASPDSGRGWPGSYLRSALGNVSRVMGESLSTVDDLDEAARCVELLLDAGTTERGYRSGEPRDTSWTGQLAMTAIAHLTGQVRSKEPGFMGPALRLMRRLHAEGFDINEDTGSARVPPVISAIRQGNIKIAAELIRLGCRTDVARPGGPAYSGVVSLESEAAAMGPEVLAAINEALMDRQLGASVVPAPQPGRTRRALSL